MKWKKYGIIGNKDMAYNSWSIRKVMEMNIISGQQNQGYYIPRR